MLGNKEGDAVLIVDETIEAKLYTDENELICWHYDHSSGKHVKSVNMLTALYYSKGISVPCGVEFVTKHFCMHLCTCPPLADSLW
ncbi:MAG: hypothetical protein KatS3mg028_0992 [Bacteroidia bacterium]|nr:MAG: hypothetical protein KatS3mg028_0992 [Bacteroidia bacterium]